MFVKTNCRISYLSENKHTHISNDKLIVNEVW